MLELLLDHPQGLQQSEIAAALRCSKTSVFRIGMTLLEHGYLVRDAESKAFSLSRKLVAMGSRVVAEEDLLTLSVDVLKSLRDRLRETVLIGTNVENELVVLGQALGSHPFKFSVDLGTRLPLHTAAPGKAILAFLPSGEREAIVSRLPFTRYTRRTITDAAEFLRELAEVRALGYALDRGEQLTGIHCVAAPVFNRHGYPVAAVWTTGPTDRLRETDLAAAGTMMAAQAGAISKRLGYGLLARNGSNGSNGNGKPSVIHEPVHQ
jgi:DNA-binding IclR family transcriptional regulator